MMTATNLKANVVELNKAAAAVSKAKVKDFGTANVIAVSDELSAKMESAAKTYSNTQKSLKGMLPKLRTIGAVLNEYRALFGKDDRAFGKAISSTVLGKIDRRDRADYMRLDQEWDRIEQLRKDGIITSNSVGVIMKQLRDADSAKAEVAKTPTAAGKSDAPTVSAKAEAEQAADSEAVSGKQVTALSLAQMVLAQLTKNGISEAEFLNALESLSK